MSGPSRGSRPQAATLIRVFVVAVLVVLAALSAGSGGAPRKRDALAEVPGLGGVTAVDAAGNHSLALDRHGRVLAWGSTEAGVGGPEPDQDCSERTPSSTYYPCRPSPGTVPLPGPATAIASADDAQIALLADGSVWAWGADHHPIPTTGERCPAGAPYPCRRTPARVAGLPPVRSVAGGLDHFLALDRDGRVWQWGSRFSPAATAICTNVAGFYRYACAPDPVVVGGLPPVVAVRAHGTSESIALDAEGGAWRWPGFAARASDPEAAPTRVPVPVAVADAGVGDESGQVVLVGRDGSVWVTGRVEGLAANDCGRSCSRTPVATLPPGSATAAAARGGLRVRTSDGRILVRARGGAAPDVSAPITTWTPEPDLDGAAGIAIGGAHTLVLRPDGVVLAKGYNADGQLGL